MSFFDRRRSLYYEKLLVIWNRNWIMDFSAPALPSAQTQEATRAHDQRTEELRIIFIALMPAAVVAVILRLVSRRVARMRIWWDDYMTLIALAFAIGLNVDLLLGTFHGMGQHVEFAGKDGVTYNGKVNAQDSFSKRRTNIEYDPGGILRRDLLHDCHGCHQNFHITLLLSSIPQRSAIQDSSLGYGDGGDVLVPDQHSCRHIPMLSNPIPLGS